MPKGKLNVPGPGSRAPIEKRFWSRVKKSSRGCWEWLGVRWPNGYGRIIHKGKQWKAHRMAIELTQGPLPEEMIVLHKCDNPGCVNPKHLVVGTSEDNYIDMILKGRQAKGERVNTSKLTEAQVKEARRKHKNGQSGASLAREYGISEQSMYALLDGRNWKHVK